MKIAALETMSANTILSSPVKPRDLVQAAKKRGYEAVALTDVDFSFGLPEFYQAAKEAGIKPILGLSARLSGLVDDQRRYDLVFLAKNFSKISSQIFLYLLDSTSILSRSLPKKVLFI